MPKLYIMCGIPGSGKTTFARKLALARNAHLVSSDSIREELTGDANNQDINHRVFEVMHERIHQHLVNGRNVIADATNIKRWSRKQIVDLKTPETAVFFIVMDTSLHESKRRNQSRDRVVPEEVIDRMWKNFEFPQDDEGIVFFVDDEVAGNIP